MSNNPRYFVDHKTRMCRILSGPPDGEDHLLNIRDAIKSGFIEVAGPDELDAFRAVTQSARDSGWNPGRIRYDTWLAKRSCGACPGCTGACRHGEENP